MTVGQKRKPFGNFIDPSGSWQQTKRISAGHWDLSETHRSSN